MDKHHTFSIQQVSELTGLSKQVIRKWEDRYSIIKPERLENGYRVYSQFEIDLLNKTVEYIDQGYAIKQAATLAKNYLDTVKQQPTPLNEPFFDKYVDLLEDYGSIGDDVMITHTLQQVHLTHGVEHCLNDVVVPFLRRIGDLWCEKKWGEYQEAISSSTIRDFLASLRRTIIVPQTAPLIVGSCLPFERHENPMHILLLQCMLNGYRTIMLGAAPAPTAIQSTVQMMKPKYVFLTGTTDEIMIDNGKAIREIDQFAATIPETKFFIGGAAVKKNAKKLALEHLQEVHSLEGIFKS
ncbi:MAG: MerR family transcriptional regulator [Lysinibacillus sp.]